jgi:hypothetical protein
MKKIYLIIMPYIFSACEKNMEHSPIELFTIQEDVSEFLQFSDDFSI